MDKQIRPLQRPTSSAKSSTVGPTSVVHISSGAVAPRRRYGSRRGHGGGPQASDGTRPATGSHNPQAI
ncbi:hypothetical protein ACLOJK_005322, partial [Asimina triloba]